MSPKYSLDGRDLIRGAFTSVAAAFIYVTMTLVAGEGFSLFTIDWPKTADMTFKAMYLAFCGHLVTNVFTDHKGNLFGIGSKETE
jgi:hypothetical protein